jgi:hypothetical protein
MMRGASTGSSREDDGHRGSEQRRGPATTEVREGPERSAFRVEEPGDPGDDSDRGRGDERSELCVRWPGLPESRSERATVIAPKSAADSSARDDCEHGG